MMKIFLKSLAVLTFAFLISLGPSWAKTSGTNPLTILMVHSYDRTSTWTLDQEEAFTKGILGQYPGAIFYHEYLATKKFSSDTYYKHVIDLFRVKYSQEDIDYIYTTDDDATHLMVSAQDLIWPSQSDPIPLVFSGLNKGFDYPDHVFGVQEVSDVAGTIDLIRRVHGTRARILAITDTTTSSKSIVDLNQLDARDKSDDAFELLMTGNVEKIKASLKAKQYDALLFLLFNRDDLGNHYSYLQGYELFEASITEPVYSTWNFYFGHGLVGGKLIDGKQQGLLASQVLVANHKDANNRQVVEANNQFIFDYRALKDHSIDLNRLPDHAVIINRPENYFQRHRDVILIATVIIIGLLMVIYLLSRSLKRHIAALEASHIKVLELQKHQGLYQILVHLSHEINSFIGNAISLISHTTEEVNQLHQDIDAGQVTKSGTLTTLKELARAQGRTEENLNRATRLLETLKGDNLLHEVKESVRIDLHQVYETALASHWEKLKTSGIHIERVLQDPCDFWADPSDISFILSELIDNARLHGFQNANTPLPTISLKMYCDPSTNSLHIAFSDNGLGISKEKLPYIFDPLYSASLSNTRGMGLFFVKQLAEFVYGGSISCQSPSEGGTSFKISLPTKKP